MLGFVPVILNATEVGDDEREEEEEEEEEEEDDADEDRKVKDDELRHVLNFNPKKGESAVDEEVCEEESVKRTTEVGWLREG